MTSFTLPARFTRRGDESDGLEDDGCAGTAGTICGGGGAETELVRALCAAYEISRPTGYLWLQRYREQGVAGIAERSRKPHHSPRRTGDELERQVTELRLRYPDWGARKLQVLLAREGVQLPRNTIHRILRRHDLVEPEERGTAATRRFERSQPNRLWQTPPWEYPTGAWVLKVDCQGKLDIQGKKWKINRSLAGEWVQVVRVGQRMMVFYCTTLIRELDPGIQRSKSIERWIPRPSSSPPTIKDV